MSPTLLENIKSLHELRLAQDVKTLCSFALTLADNSPHFLTAQDKLDVFMIYAETLYKDKDVKSALGYYQKALLLKKSALKPKGKVPSTQDDAVAAEIKYQIFVCHYDLRLFQEALAILESVTAKARTPAVHLGLARLYQRLGQDRAAITSYKEVLRECPMSLEAANALLKLGVKSPEVGAMMPAPAGCADWLSLWLRASSLTATKDYNEALNTYTRLLTKPLLSDCPDVLISNANVQLLQGNNHLARDLLERAHAQKPHMLTGMDTLAHLVQQYGKRSELEQLVPQLLSVNMQQPEPWVGLACLAMSNKRYRKSINFAQKAITLDPDCVEAHCVRGRAYLSHAQGVSAVTHFKEVIRLTPQRFEGHKGLVECYMATQRFREALNYASQTCKLLGVNCRTITLSGLALSRDPAQIEKAKNYFERAIRLDPNDLTPVYAIAEILGRQQAYNKALLILRNALQLHSTSRLHQLMGDYLMANNNSLQDALDHFSIALGLDSHNRKAQEGRERAEKHLYLPIGTIPNFDMEETRGSENEADLDESDADSTWSDLDMQP